MPKDYFNDPIERATGQNSAASPQSLMFERLISNLQSTLDEEVFFDDSDWAGGFDWGNETDAVWEGLAEDATMRMRRPRPIDLGCS
ncbi:hypothetical protein A3753_30925 [Sulfitobacter sp. HI0082]|nr:hypothetical protein A3753_15400 [Sulfitobacter sp. HI0082]KZZ27483.1 hypothetical protein A3753_30925 [Sulfitobacter sp. HI0082]